MYTADLNQEKEVIEVTTFYDGEACTPKEEFASGGQCYPCDSSGSYYISSQYEYESCRACGRRMAVGNYCVPGCMAGQVYDKGKCVTPECSSNSDCRSGWYCELDFSIGPFESSCTQQPPYGHCKEPKGTTKTVSGVGTYQKSGSEMNWWSAQNYCEAIGGRMVTVADFDCGDTTCDSDNFKAFQTAFGTSDILWTSDLSDACRANLVFLSNSRGSTGRGNDDAYALCRVGD